MQEESPSKISPLVRLLLQALFVFFSGLFLFLILGLGALIVDLVWHAGRILPGVSMHGIDLSGMELHQAEQLLSKEISFGPQGTVTLRYADLEWPVLPSQIGLQLDAPASARIAYEYGRQGSLGSILAYQLLGRHSSHELQPIVTFNEETAFRYLQRVSQEYDLPVQEASLSLSGTRVVANPGQVGRHLDILKSIDHIANHVRLSDFSPVNLVVIEEQPEILDASTFAAQAQELLSHPFELVIPEGQTDAGRAFTIQPEELAPMLTFRHNQENGQTALQPLFEETLLQTFLLDIFDRTAIFAQNARFIFNDDTRQLDLLSSAVTGRQLNLSQSRAAAQSAIRSGQSTTALAFDNLPPAVADDATADDLGITELIFDPPVSSYFFGSTEPRVQNIEKAASEFHGLLVAPGETFSMAANMGAISLDNGYSEALIIYDGRTIEGVGGGVCQVSTTLFRAAFFAGFPVVERYPHAYRVSYYEKTAGNGRNANLAGLDATVFIPLVDLKFINDTPDWLLMETYVNRAAKSITWKFYSTSDGRSVEWETTGPVNIVEPKKPMCKKNPKLEPGEIKQIEWEAQGADVRVDRTVLRGGQAIFSDAFFTHYAPWRAVYEYGPGTDGIPPECTEEDG